MTTELPLNQSRSYESGAAIGGNLAGGATAFNDTRAIDQILGQAAQSGNPQDMTNVMQSILAKVSPDKQKEAMQLLQSRHQAVQKQKQQGAIQEAGYNPNMPMDLIKEQMKQKGVQQKELQAQNQKMQPLQTGLEVLSRQRELLKQGNLGPAMSVFGTPRKSYIPTKAALKDRSEYERLGKSLISLATTIPIRNRLEFETLAENLYDPKKTQEEIKGSLDGMERILKNNISQFQQQGTQNQQGQQQPQFQVGQTFQSLPPQAPEGAIMGTPDGKEMIFRNGQWSPR